MCKSHKVDMGCVHSCCSSPHSSNMPSRSLSTGLEQFLEASAKREKVSPQPLHMESWSLPVFSIQVVNWVARAA